MLELKANKRLYPKYEEYKDSGIDWLEEVPVAWRVLKLKNIGTFSAGGIDKKINEGEIPVSMVNYMDIYGNSTKAIDNKRELMTVTCPEWKILECNLKKGDLLFTPSSETCEDIGLSALILDDLSNTVYSYHVVRLRFSQDIDLNYKKYLCNNHFVLNQFSKASKGTTRQILNRIEFKNIDIVLPSTLEQQKIADFMGKETEKIDKLIDKKQKLIDLLKEKRTALISQAVTKGLDLKAKMKDSGVPWLGQIPEHWEIKRLKDICLANTRELSDKTDPNYCFKYVEIGSVKLGEIISDTEEQAFSEAPSRARRIVIKGDTIISTVRTYLKAIYHFEEEIADVVVSTGFAVLSPKKDIDPEYLFYLVRSEKFIDSVMANSDGVSYPAINPTKLLSLAAWLPPHEEQTRIAHELNVILKRIGLAINKIENQIEKIKEYRIALISSAVTGKIKV